MTALCQCGCGHPVNVPTRNHRSNGWIAGQPMRFIQGHHMKLRPWRGPEHPMWKGGRKSERGYILIHRPAHGRAYRSGYVKESIMIAEHALGHPLPRHAVVHHANGIRSDNRPQNLVICQDTAYHHGLHQRERSYRACGHAEWRKCQVCKQYDAPRHLYIGPNPSPIYHRTCSNARRRDQRGVR